VSVRHALLALLIEGPKYGLQLREEFEARTGEVWPLNVGQVYTTLQRLERDGLVESEGDGQDGSQKDGPQKGFRITAAGTDVAEVIQVHRRYLVELMQQWTRIKESESESDMSLALVVDAELFRLDSVIRWLDAADGRIKRSGLENMRSAAPGALPEASGALPGMRRRVGVRK
jgi:DNA-binding PadR family transcriptional regulator